MMDEVQQAERARYDDLSAKSTDIAPLREAQREHDQAIERLAMLTEKLIARIEPILLPDETVDGRVSLEHTPQRSGSEITHALRQWRHQVAAISDSVERTLARIDV